MVTVWRIGLSAASTAYAGLELNSVTPRERGGPQVGHSTSFVEVVALGANSEDLLGNYSD